MPELAWALCEKYWGKRIIDEVGTALIDSLARAGITQVCATAALHNESSARVMQVLGLEKHSECDFFRPDGTVRRSHFYVRKI